MSGEEDGKLYWKNRCPHCFSRDLSFREENVVDAAGNVVEVLFAAECGECRAAMTRDEVRLDMPLDGSCLDVPRWERDE